MARFLWVCLGGAAGSGARFLLSGWAVARLGPGFPWGTLAVNVLGSFVLAAIMVVATTTELLSPTARLALTSGVMGGFTTYSSFNYETTQLFQSGSAVTGAINIAATVIGCLIAGVCGHFAARLVLGR